MGATCGVQTLLLLSSRLGSVSSPPTQGHHARGGVYGVMCHPGAGVTRLPSVDTADDTVSVFAEEIAQMHP